MTDSKWGSWEPEGTDKQVSAVSSGATEGLFIFPSWVGPGFYTFLL